MITRRKALMKGSDRQAGREARVTRRPYRRILGFSSIALILALMWAAFVCNHAWRETQLREAYLPDLQAYARRDLYNGRLLGLLGVRLCEARQFGAAGQAFEKAAGAGET